MHVVWINAGDGRLCQTHRPRSLPYLMQDMLHLKEAGTDHVVSCLTQADEARWGLLDEERLAVASGLKFSRFAIVDHQVPDDADAFDAFAQTLATELKSGQSAIVHCYAGIGRSGMLTVAALVHCGLSLVDAINAAQKARGLRVPETEPQFRFLQHLYGA